MLFRRFMRRTRLALLLVCTMFLAGCLGPDTAEWGSSGIEVEIDSNPATEASITTNLGASKSTFESLSPVGCDVGILMAIMANNRRHATLTLDGHPIEDDFTLFLIQNSQTGGSLLPLAPGASLDDGMMDIGILKKMKRGQILKAFGQLKKEGRHVFHPMVDYYRFKKLDKELADSEVAAGPAFGQQDVWTPPPKRDSAPVSNVVSSERAPKRTEHFSSVRQDSSHKPKTKSAKAPVKRRAAKKRKAVAPAPKEAEPEYEAKPEPQTFDDDDDFSDFSF